MGVLETVSGRTFPSNNRRFPHAPSVVITTQVDRFPNQVLRVKHRSRLDKLRLVKLINEATIPDRRLFTEVHRRQAPFGLVC